MSATPDGRVAQKALKLDAIVFTPGTQEKPSRLNPHHFLGLSFMHIYPDPRHFTALSGVAHGTEEAESC